MDGFTAHMAHNMITLPFRVRRRCQEYNPLIGERGQGELFGSDQSGRR